MNFNHVEPRPGYARYYSPLEVIKMNSVTVIETSQVAEARRASLSLARGIGFDEEACGRVALVTTELATNLVKHASGGHILSAIADDREGTAGIEVVAIDKGRGVANVERRLERRQFHGRDLGARVGSGTAAIRGIRNIYPNRSRHRHRGADHRKAVAAGLLLRRRTGRRCRPGGRVHPNAGEAVSGDAWAVRTDEGGRTMMVVDGLGHGPEAAKVAPEATRLFDKYWRSGPMETLQALHAGLRATRGGAVAVARVEWSPARVRYAGVGNIAGAIATTDGRLRRMLSYNGTIGHTARNIQEQVYPLEQADDATIIMHSDGIGTSWSLDLLSRSAVTTPMFAGCGPLS